MLVRDAMSGVVLTVGPAHSLREAARQMSTRGVGAAVVHDGDVDGLGIITERDVLHAVGAGQDPNEEQVGDHLTTDLVFASPDMTLQEAAALMTRGGFRHLVVLDAGEVVGIVSVRDIVRQWAEAAIRS
ncbi:MAG: cyclic nucleotide-binding/CBS domain-containing protein [Frankiaceae bacterium]